MRNNSQAINITIPKELLKKVDLLAKRDFTSRSDVIRQALLDKTRSDGVYDIEDEEGWKTLVDFREINPDGVSAKELLKAMNKVRKERANG